MAFAARFPTLVAGAFLLWGGSIAPAQVTSAPPAPPDNSLSAGAAPAQPLPSFGGGATVSLLGYVLTIVVLGAAGVTVLLRGGFFGLPWGAAKTARKLRIEETRSVGSRQHLIVAEYDGRRMLLGISPGRIEYLCGLDSEAATGEAGFSDALSAANLGGPGRSDSANKDEALKEGR